MDPDVLAFLRAQQFQPLVEIDTTWLEVGHVDEIVAFVPAPRERARFAALRASPGVAMALVREARRRYRDGLDELDPFKHDWRPSGVFPRETDKGTCPVTMLLRGQVWLHSHPRDALQALLPPRLYRQMAHVNAQFGVSIHELFFWPGEGDDRRYPAAVSVEELLHFEPDEHGHSVNDFIEAELLEPVHAQLTRELPEVGIYPLPVVFDTIPDLAAWAEGARDAATAAFVPDVANLQVVNGRLLIPKPHGPRMRPADAIATVRAVLGEHGLSRLGSRLTERFLRNRRLDTTTVWLRPTPPTIVENTPGGTVRQLFGGYQDVADVARAFRDGFPKVDPDKVAERILEANRAHFQSDGTLRAGWRKLVIPERTVDIFEAWTEVILEALGVRAHWVDSWFYHVRFGEIHCGTNVLREPPPRATPWWRVRQKVDTIEFEDEEPL
jgi:Protein-arginine deiminase (PAD)